MLKRSQGYNTMTMTHKLFISTLIFASATHSQAAMSNNVNVDEQNKPTTVRIDSIPEVSVTCYRCDELARKYRSSAAHDETVSVPTSLNKRQQRKIQETEEAE